jgi:hypothetical protein
VKILAVSDEEIPALWDYYVPGRLDDYDLIISCGDLRADYLSFLVTMAHCPVLYVHGNHDTGYATRPPEGCDCIDDAIVEYRGLRILGLGGCRWYHEGPHQYTEAQMRRRIRKLRYALWKTGGVDIVVTHAPPEGLGDDTDPAHRGFKALIELLDKYHPKYLLHGHVHLRYGQENTRNMEYNGSHVVNVCPRYTLEVPSGDYNPKDRFRVIWKTRHKEL